MEYDMLIEPNTLNFYEQELYNIIEYMFNNSIFNTYITSVDENTEFSIILKTKNPRLTEILGHLGRYKKIKENDPILDDKCSICIDNYKINEYKRILGKCNHSFHKKCVDKWFKKNKDNMNCPICRTNYNRKIEL